jgi:hypothetical protein
MFFSRLDPSTLDLARVHAPRRRASRDNTLTDRKSKSTDRSTATTTSLARLDRGVARHDRTHARRRVRTRANGRARAHATH